MSLHPCTYLVYMMNQPSLSQVLTVDGVEPPRLRLTHHCSLFMVALGLPHSCYMPVASIAMPAM